MPEAIALDWLQRAHLPLFLITYDLRLIWANASAAELMTRHELRVNPFGYFRCSNKDIEIKVDAVRQQLLAVIAQRETWPDRATVLALTEFSGSNLGLYELTVSGMSLIGCAVMMADEGAKDLSERLSHYGLTNTERKVVAMLAGGATAIEIARASGCSLLTVRTHIKRAYEKMEVNSREKMFARLTGRASAPSVEHRSARPLDDPSRPPVERPFASI